MRMIPIASIAALGLTMLAVAPAFAHHSFDVDYDTTKIANLSGVVTKLDWTNPHAYLSIAFKDESGATKTVAIELGPPYALTRGGWKRDTVKIGDKVSVEDAALSKDGSPRAGATQNTKLVLASGEKLPMR
jgi:Family of unknown function (DUF6152)